MTTEHLIFQLHGALASWGDVAVGNVRPTAERPTRSAILGLVAAALGLDGRDDEVHRALSESISVAVRVDAWGDLLQDFHTVQAPPKGMHTFPTRAAELDFAARDLNTIVTRRDYRSDATYTVALWSRAERPAFTLSRIKEALERPRFVLYLGRKSCPPSLPLGARFVHASTLREALQSARFPPWAPMDRESSEGAPVFWDSTQHHGLRLVQEVRRRDEPISRRRRQFADRVEHQGSFEAAQGGR